MGAYTFDDISKIRAGRLGGRKAFSKQFKRDLVEMYGAKDGITGERLDERYLQIDHRIPYEVGGDDGDALNPVDFMLLDASSNRAKSWSCEHCENFLIKRDSEICKNCFWASPENYEHIAETPSRRIELVWSGREVAQYEKLKAEAKQWGLEMTAFLKEKLGQ